MQEDLVQIFPMVSEATAMAEELGKGVKFEITLVSPQARGQKDGKTEVHNGCCDITILLGGISFSETINLLFNQNIYDIKKVVEI